MKWRGYACALGATAACTLAGLALGAWLELVNIAMVYLLAVVLVALHGGRGAVVAASILNVAAYNFFFVPPRGTFHVEDPQYLVTFGLMLAVGLIVSWLTETVRARAQAQADLAVQAETERIRNALLSSISHDLRTPLAVISGASSSLAEGGERMAVEERRALAQSIFRESQDMSELVAKVLQMTRLESGGLPRERRAARRAHLGRAAAGGGHRLSFFSAVGNPAGDARRSACQIDEMTQATILVVEDEPDIRRFLRSSLGAEGYRVVESPNGR